MVGARVKPPLQRPARQRLGRDQQTRLIGRRYQQQATGDQHAARLAQQQPNVNDVLKRLTAPDKVKRIAGKRQRAVLFDADKLDLRRPQPRAAQRLVGNINADDRGASAGQRRAERAITAAKVKDFLPGS